MMFRFEPKNQLFTVFRVRGLVTVFVANHDRRNGGEFHVSIRVRLHRPEEDHASPPAAIDTEREHVPADERRGYQSDVVHDLGHLDSPEFAASVRVIFPSSSW